jgi:chondroitin AC lyase
MSNEANLTYRKCRNLVNALFVGQESDFNVTARKESEKKPVPPPPANLVAMETTNTSIKLTWDPSSHATFYKVFYGMAATPPQMAFYNTTTKAAIVVEGLTEGTKYYFSIKACNSSGESASSNVTDRRTL